MEIINQLKEKVFGNNFLTRMVDNYNYLRNNFQKVRNNGGYKHPFFQARLGKNYQSIFLSVLAEEVHQKLPNCRVLLSVDMILEEQDDSLPYFPDMRIGDMKRMICNPEWISYCFRKIEKGGNVRGFHSTKCFGGREWSTEVDVAISKDSEELCFIEYEESYRLLCNNFMKLYRLKRLTPQRRFESLFVTRLSDRKGNSSLDKFDNYIAKASPILHTLLEEWRVLALINLFSGKPRLKWYPS
jgi:hypothetical protein